MPKSYYVYILTNKSNTLYIGVTSNLIHRVYQHQNKVVKGFSSKYNLNKLIYFEEYENVDAAIAREKQLKGWRRGKKINIVKGVNQEFEEIELT